MSEIESDEDPMAICGHLSSNASSSESDNNDDFEEEDKEIQEILESSKLDTRMYSRESGYVALTLWK